jgi:hypothetical protein
VSFALLAGGPNSALGTHFGLDASIFAQSTVRERSCDEKYIRKAPEAKKIWTCGPSYRLTGGVSCGPLEVKIEQGGVQISELD